MISYRELRYPRRTVIHGWAYDYNIMDINEEQEWDAEDMIYEMRAELNSPLMQDNLYWPTDWMYFDMGTHHCSECGGHLVDANEYWDNFESVADFWGLEE